MYFETKGYFDSDSRKKMKWVFDSNPGIKLVMVLERPDKKIRKGSPTSYAQWCTKNNIPWIGIDDLLEGNFK